MERMLLLMEKWDVKATCLILGWIAERSLRVVHRIAEAGHEIASHGYGHQLVHELDPAAFRADVERSKRILEDIAGQPVLGYRAPSFSLTEWASPALRMFGAHAVPWAGGGHFRLIPDPVFRQSRWTALLRDFSWMPIRDLIAYEVSRASSVSPGGGSHEGRSGGRRARP